MTKKEFEEKLKEKNYGMMVVPIRISANDLKEISQTSWESILKNLNDDNEFFLKEIEKGEIEYIFNLDDGDIYCNIYVNGEEIASLRDETRCAWTLNLFDEDFAWNKLLEKGKIEITRFSFVESVKRAVYDGDAEFLEELCKSPNEDIRCFAKRILNGLCFNAKVDRLFGRGNKRLVITECGNYLCFDYYESLMDESWASNTARREYKARGGFKIEIPNITEE